MIIISPIILIWSIHTVALPGLNQSLESLSYLFDALIILLEQLIVCLPLLIQVAHPVRLLLITTVKINIQIKTLYLLRLGSKYGFGNDRSFFQPLINFSQETIVFG